jgi:hypothetical protein
MNRTFKKIFQTNPALLEEMLELRKSNPILWTYSALGRKYGTDHTVIMNWCKKKGLVIDKTINSGRNIKRNIDHTSIILQSLPVRETFGEKINGGVMYQTYISREKKRLLTKAEVLLNY